jgi:hypothetical protein
VHQVGHTAYWAKGWVRCSAVGPPVSFFSVFLVLEGDGDKGCFGVRANAEWVHWALGGGVERDIPDARQGGLAPDWYATIFRRSHGEKETYSKEVKLMEHLGVVGEDRQFADVPEVLAYNGGSWLWGRVDFVPSSEKRFEVGHKSVGSIIEVKGTWPPVTPEFLSQVQGLL